MYQQKTKTIGFFVLMAVVGLAVILLFWPFWELLAFAAILAMLFYPLYKNLNNATHSPNSSAGFVVFVIAAIIAGPIWLIGQQVFYELSDLYHSLNLGSSSLQSDFISKLPMSLQQLALTFNVDFHTWASQLTGQAFTTLSGILSSLGWLFGSLVVIFFSVFFLLRDGHKIKKLLMDTLPLSEANENILFSKLEQAVGGVVKGQFLVVLTISTASFIGFSIFGLPNALLWACVMFVAAFVPTFGTSLVWLPAILFLYFTGHIGAAIGMAFWAWISVILIDNILAAKLVSSRVRLHPLLTIFAILGGIVSFGVLGVLFGPILVAIFVALVDIYRMEIKGLPEK